MKSVFKYPIAILCLFASTLAWAGDGITRRKLRCFDSAGKEFTCPPDRPYYFFPNHRDPNPPTEVYVAHSPTKVVRVFTPKRPLEYDFQVDKPSRVRLKCEWVIEGLQK